MCTKYSAGCDPRSDQEGRGFDRRRVRLSWRLIMKYFLRSFSPFRLFKKGSCQFLSKEIKQGLVNRLEDGNVLCFGCLVLFYRAFKTVKVMSSLLTDLLIFLVHALSS